MRSFHRVSVSIALLVGAAGVALAADPPKPVSPDAAVAPVVKCEHGVQKTLCTRCNPQLAPVFKAKGDWCSAHERAESQCVPCNPDLAKEGVK